MQALQTIQIPNEQQIANSVGALCATAGDMIILSREDLSEATDLVKVIKTRSKEMEEERKRLVGPFNEGVKQINARFKQMSEPLDTAERGIKDKMLVFQQEENRKAEALRREAQRQAEEQAARIAAENKGPPAEAVVPVIVPVLPASPPKTTYGQFGGTSTIKKVWTYELLDVVALATARPDLVIVDSAKITALIRGQGGDIPGLRIFEKEIMSVR